MIRAVIDVNVTVSAVIGPLGFPRHVADALRLAYAYAKVGDAPVFRSPPDFYREATQRPDIRRILTELAK
jgi:hypothetical protein